MKKNYNSSDKREDHYKGRKSNESGSATGSDNRRNENEGSRGKSAGKRIPFKGFKEDDRDSRPQRSEDRGESGSRDNRRNDRSDDRRSNSSRDDRRPQRSDERRPHNPRDERRTERSDEGRPHNSRDERRTERSDERRPHSSRDERRTDRSDDTRPSHGKWEDKQERRDDTRGKSESKRGSDDRERPLPKRRKDDRRPDFRQRKEANRDSTRLNKYLAHAGICSRREADTLILAGLVKVNGTVVMEMGHQVKPSDEVRYNGSLIKSEKNVYVLLNKPKGFITTVDDPKARKTVMDLVRGACRERIYPVGRLDRQTTGLLLFTNDGDLADKLLHPSKGARKIYEAVLDKPLTQADLVKIQNGLVLDDGPVNVDSIAYVMDKDKRHIGLELHIGRNRIVRRIFAHLGYEVIKLDRVSFAGLNKKRLPRGQFRLLTDKEVDFLRMR